MTSVIMNNYVASKQLTQPVDLQNKANVNKETPAGVEANKEQVNISEEAKLLQAASVNADQSEKGVKDRNLSDDVESFAYGALGMEHPDEVEEEKDGSYTAGQYLKGALTVGALILAVV
ncbi:hypothetical protein GCM10007916_12530 [Psychromonas marina]|uniref:Uncharacterized protein n=1 Tax=Psychromonas marina TaxID=88364 RepID=A0ABQ6DYE9_9GAMM|nr:hypothetical protein [Psychromonas marina]GLS90186.1 hypothetical protein GCM10007916_12530 [Psychromonas marina]